MSRSERVRHAREFCGLTQVELADLAGLGQARVSEIEAGRRVARIDEIEAVAAATSFPMSFFERGALPAMPDGNFRRLKRGTAKAGSQVRAQARQLMELIELAEQFVELPPVRLEPVTHIGSDSDIEDAANALRHSAGIGADDPVPNVTRALERAGVIVAALPNEIIDHDGYSVWPDFGLGGRPLIVYSHGTPGDRQRFTEAHEAGHLVLHSVRRQEPVEIDRAEREAHRFAGAFLLPQSVAITALAEPLTLSTLINVKATYGISIAAGAQRAKDLGLISADRFVSIRKQLSARGWNRTEPQPISPEQPQVIRKLIAMISSGTTLSQRAASIHFPVFAYRALSATQ